MKKLTLNLPGMIQMALTELYIRLTSGSKNISCSASRNTTAYNYSDYDNQYYNHCHYDTSNDTSCKTTKTSSCPLELLVKN